MNCFCLMRWSVVGLYILFSECNENFKRIIFLQRRSVDQINMAAISFAARGMVCWMERFCYRMTVMKLELLYFGILIF